MPHDIHNIVRGPREVIAGLLNEQGQVDFERIIPSPELKADGSQENAGSIWCVKHWGTTCNGFQTRLCGEGNEGVLRFGTAWSHPWPVIQQLSETYPYAFLRVEFADEDLGRNIGAYTVKAGQIGDDLTVPAERTQRAREFASWVIYNQSYEATLKEWGEIV